jgi:hypothetical protein
MKTREDILSERALNFFNCKEFVKLGVIEREKFEALKNKMTYRSSDAPEIVRDAAWVGKSCYHQGLKPTIFHCVESVLSDVSHTCIKRFPALHNEPMVEWAEAYYDEVMK